MRLAPLLFYAVVALAVLGGSACSLPYAVPVIEEPPSPAAAAFPGIAGLRASGSPLRVFWTHGMCSHDIGWVANRIGLLERAIGTRAKDSPPAAAEPGRPYTVTRTFETPDGDIQVSYFVWSPLTSAFKRDLAFDAPPTLSGGLFGFDRAGLNGSLKTGLMNDCLVDAVVYSGRNGDPIRAAMEQAVCAAVGGTISANYCDIPSMMPEGPLVIVTESLGSKMVFDAVRNLWNAAAARPGAASEGFATQLARVPMLFMLANQVPILDQANPLGPHEAGSGPAPAAVPRTASRSSLADFSRLAAEARRSAAPRPAVQGPEASVPGLTVVAFTDPNDLFSYRLQPVAQGITETRVVNVITSNSTTYFGYVERPDAAHCGYGGNAHVVGLLVHGYHPGQPMPSAAIVESGACGIH